MTTETTNKSQDHQDLKSMMADLQLGYKELAEITGNSYNSVKTVLQPGKELPRWVHLAIYVWEQKRQE
jgi:hypothetical protein